jgi:beta-glucosidase
MAKSNSPLYRNPDLSPRERARDLMGQMTLNEKIGQLNQRLYGFAIYETEPEMKLTDEFKSEVEKWSGIGTIYGLYRADPWTGKTEDNGITPEKSMEVYNMVQRYVIEHSRLGIPALLSTECPHGHQALGGGILPVNTAAGSTFDEKLLEEAYEACGRQLRDGHVDFALMSMLDVLRDARWGRCEECYSEDPVLCKRLSAAAVTGMQKTGVYSVAKHFCAQGETTGGVNASAARIGERELREIHLPPAEGAVEAGAMGVMAAYNEIDGVNCHANAHLLKDILRDEMGFKGVVMADGCAIDNLDRVTDDNVESGALALKSGVNISLWDQGFTRLEEAVNRGLITEADIDEALLPVLVMKFERGLFEHPYMDKNMGSEKDYGIDKLSLKMAEESVVLLKNKDNLLPVREAKKIAVIGENADSGYALMGDYTPPRKAQDMVSVLQGLKQTFGDAKVTYLQEAFEEGKLQELSKKLINEFDLVLFVTGGSSSRFEGAEFDKNGASLSKGGRMECGEGMDRADLECFGKEADFIEGYLKGRIPVVTVCVAGRPYATEKMADTSDALLYAFYPGPFGGTAISRIIAGEISPTGRLSASLPRSSGQLPVYYNYKDSYEGIKYCDTDGKAAFSFGEGLMYSDIKYSQPEFILIGNEPEVEAPNEKVLEIKMKVQNTGTYGAVAVPQLYIHRHAGGTTARIIELKDFSRIELMPGEEKELELNLKTEDLIFYDYQMKPSVKGGYYDVVLKDQGKEIGRTLLGYMSKGRS